MKEVIARVSERFENLERIEVVSPFATIRGLCRLAQAETARRIHLRVHVFETILNALAPRIFIILPISKTRDFTSGQSWKKPIASGGELIKMETKSRKPLAPVTVGAKCSTLRASKSR